MLALALLVACKPDPTPGAVPTWYADAKPVVDQHCVRCHTEGGLGVGDFTDPDQAVAFGERMVARAEAGEMPPPTTDPACRDFEGSEHMRLDDAELDVLRAWVDGGRALGDPADDPEVEVLIPALEDPDLELRLDAPYTPTWWDSSNPGNEYRCFLVDPGLDEDVFITAMHPIVDQDALMHHIVVYSLAEQDIPAEYWAEGGVDCIGGSALDTEGMLTAWAPGMMPVEFPEGRGMRIEAGHVLVLQMHYFRAGPQSDGLADQSGYAFQLADSVEREVYMAPLGVQDFRIPAGDAAYTDGDTLRNTFGVDLTLYGVFPHMHQLGAHYSLWVEDGGQTECLLEGDYDFDNQLTYMYREPASFPQGSELGFSCTWDNSTDNPNLPYDEPVETRYGERTDEEMCYFFTFYAIE